MDGERIVVVKAAGYHRIPVRFVHAVPQQIVDPYSIGFGQSVAFTDDRGKGGTEGVLRNRLAGAENLHAPVVVVIAVAGHELDRQNILVLVRIHPAAHADLLQVGDAGDAAGTFAGGIQSGQQQRRKDRDDRYNNQKFNQGKTSFTHIFLLPRCSGASLLNDTTLYYKPAGKTREEL